MGLLITSYLITCNVYGSVEAPPNRGFSYIDIWATGIQCNILMAIIEFTCIIAMKRTNIKQNISSKKNVDDVAGIIDFISLITSFIFFCLFNLVYWWA